MTQAAVSHRERTQKRERRGKRGTESEKQDGGKESPDTHHHHQAEAAVSTITRTFLSLEQKELLMVLNKPACLLIIAGLTAAGSIQHSYLDSQFNLQKKFVLN
jgi:hypothetical protein